MRCRRAAAERSTSIRSLFGPQLWPRDVELLKHPGTPLDSDPSFETYDVDGAIDAILLGLALPRVPLAVMSKTEPFAASPTAPPDVLSRLDEVWPFVQAELVPLRPQTPHIFATGSSHYVQMQDPDLPPLKRHTGAPRGDRRTPTSPRACACIGRASGSRAA